MMVHCNKKDSSHYYYNYETDGVDTVKSKNDVISVEGLVKQDSTRDWDAGSIACIFGPFLFLFVIIIVISLINMRLSAKNKRVHPDIEMKPTDMTSYKMYTPTKKDRPNIEKASECSCSVTESCNSLPASHGNSSTSSRMSLILPGQIKCCHCRLREFQE
ncbi:uncharacterized protein LOC117115405 isoform X2 [Anneissia japonica]|uniref:uncharacterized protein LOC117115405 isoform X2 n=1 Tax=Anneissia japonica TaxID=1529436 RepID=UPI00142580BE|nr:uncharacterized protein LOC117115405 isoform X2 [Anneissia japonica]